jgi:hypothetical protein
VLGVVEDDVAEGGGALVDLVALGGDLDGGGGELDAREPVVEALGFRGRGGGGEYCRTAGSGL